MMGSMASLLEHTALRMLRSDTCGMHASYDDQTGACLELGVMLLLQVLDFALPVAQLRPAALQLPLADAPEGADLVLKEPRACHLEVGSDICEWVQRAVCRTRSSCMKLRSSSSFFFSASNVSIFSSSSSTLTPPASRAAFSFFSFSLASCASGERWNMC